MYTRSCCLERQSQQAQFDITERPKTQMKNRRQDRTDIKHPKQLQQLQTFSGFPLSAWCLFTAVVSGFRKSSEAFYIVRKSWKAQRAGVPLLSGNWNHSSDQDLIHWEHEGKCKAAPVVHFWRNSSFFRLQCKQRPVQAVRNVVIFY